MICQAKGLSCYLISNLEYEIQTSDPLDVVEILSHFNEITIQIFCCVNDECVNDINSSFKRQEQELLCKRTFAELKLSQNVASLVYLMLFVSYHYSTGNTHTHTGDFTHVSPCHRHADAPQQLQAEHRGLLSLRRRRKHPETS